MNVSGSLCSVTSVNPHNNGDLGGLVPILCTSSLVVQLELGTGWCQECLRREGGWEARRAA